MSATIDVTIYQKHFDGPDACPVLVVAGVTYPVETKWRHQWSSPENRTMDFEKLAAEVAEVYDLEGAAAATSGSPSNILLFLPTISAVNKAVDAIEQKLCGVDPNVHVLPMYAALDKSEQDRAEKFTDLQLFPENKGKRMVCVSTNVAEAGITIPGLSAVMETGLEINVTFDAEQGMDIIKMQWISKASRSQRVGRAGRTAPGTCYCLYTEEDFESMPEYATPPILSSNLDALYDPADSLSYRAEP